MQIEISHLRLALKWIVLALALGACFGVQAQQSWPSRPLRILVPTPPGGSTDILSRMVGQKLSESLGQPVIIENRGGAGGNVGISYFIKSAPDDHFFLVIAMPMISIYKYLYRDLGYDPDLDLKPVGLIAGTANVFVTNPALKVHTLKELAEYGRAHANKLSYSSPGVGTTGHLLTELFKSNVGIEFLHVPYRGNAPAMMALIAGDVQFNADNVAQLLPQIRAGKLQALAVTSPKRLVQLPEVPTVSEAGFPNMVLTSWWSLAVQSKTQSEVITRVNRELAAILQKPDFISRLREYSIEPLTGTPEEMTASVRYERERWKKVIDAAGIKPE